jgi:cytochrome P450
VIIVWAAANRDEETFAEPEQFDRDRANLVKLPLGYGQGVHLCLGAPIAIGPA